MKYFISFKAQSTCGNMITGNCQVILDYPIDMDAIGRIEANLLEEENYKTVIIDNFIKFEENI